MTVFPIVFFTLGQKGAKKILFLIMASLPFLILISPYIFGGFEHIIQKVFSHVGIWGFWGYLRMAHLPLLKSS